MSVVHSDIVSIDPARQTICTSKLLIRIRIGIRASCQACCMGNKVTMRLWQIVDECVHLLVSGTGTAQERYDS